jgi:hypothetical protein
MYSPNYKISIDNIGIEIEPSNNEVRQTFGKQTSILKFFNYSYSTSSHAISKEMGEDDTRL